MLSEGRANTAVAKPFDREATRHSKNLTEGLEEVQVDGVFGDPRRRGKLMGYVENML